MAHYKINKQDHFLMITSTDVLSSKEILKAVKEFNVNVKDMQVSSEKAVCIIFCSLHKNVASKLVVHSLAMWKKRYGEQGEPADNTTAIVIDIKNIRYE